MSKTAHRYPLLQARIIADLALETVKPHVVQSALAGSLRRGRADVGDIDIVVQLPEDNPWGQAQLAAEVMSQLNYDATSEGPKSMHLEPSGNGEVLRPAIDIYFATSQTWGITLLVRTGSAAHNIRLARYAQTRVLPARRLTLHGIEDTAGHVVASATEEAIFSALGLAFVAPAQREAPELEHLVRVDEPDVAREGRR